MNLQEMQQEIIRLKREKNICILVHAYQSHDIWEVADFIGDSFGLTQQAAKSGADTIIMCGVLFMAETVKMLMPEKRVLLANGDAGCPMAEQMDSAMIAQMRRKMPDHKVVAYINTTAELKTVCDVCVTSSSAVKIIRAMPEQKILFIPDCNLGAWVKEQVPEKDITLLNGGCPTHARITAAEAKAAKAAHPEALLLVHPECRAEVTALADYAGSTTEIMKYAKESDAKEFIIGTETSIVQHLQLACPEKRFYALSKDLICKNMKLTTLGDVYDCVRGIGGREIEMDAETIAAARRPIDAMLAYGG
ncbi:MAG TPA: quinolinate synthase [Ruminococcus sp.]|nr:quinolinate synthase [Ruminococcus sp.]